MHCKADSYEVSVQNRVQCTHLNNSFRHLVNEMSAHALKLHSFARLPWEKAELRTWTASYQDIPVVFTSGSEPGV